jgi:NAD(P)-dependent dehydrogenase (short-subunit alcohol dehydrogenase family)
MTGMQNTVVFITGAARGIGLDTAQRLYKDGATIVLVDVDETLAKSEAEKLGTRALGIGADVTDQDQLDAAVAQAVQTYGRIDVALANAGIAPPVETIRTGSRAAFDRVLDVNLHGVIRTTRAVLPALEKTNGYLLITASLYAVVNGALSSPYATAKAAVEMFARSLRVEMAGTGIDVGVAYYGFVDTRLVRDAFAKAGIDELRSSFPKFIAAPVPVGKAGEATAAGIRKRAARITAPRWVRATLPLRGLLQYLDGPMTKEKKVRAAVEKAEARTAASD